MMGRDRSERPQATHARWRLKVALAIGCCALGLAYSPGAGARPDNGRQAPGGPGITQVLPTKPAQANLGGRPMGSAVAKLKAAAKKLRCRGA